MNKKDEKRTAYRFLSYIFLGEIKLDYMFLPYLFFWTLSYQIKTSDRIVFGRSPNK